MATAPRGTISQRIAIEGAEEIKRILTEIGQVGERAFAQVQAAVATANSRLAQVSGAVAAAERQFAALGVSGRNLGNAFNNFNRSFDAFGNSITRSATRITLFTGVVGGAAFAISAFFRGSARAADEIEEAAAGVGLTAERFQQFSTAAGLAGVSQQQFTRGIAFMQKEVLEASKSLGNLQQQREQWLASGTRNSFEDWQANQREIVKIAPHLRDINALRAQWIKQARQFQTFEEWVKEQVAIEGTGNALTKLGVSVVDVRGRIRSFDEILLETADKFSKLEEGPRKVALSLELLSRGGPRFAAFLNQGSEGIQKLLADVARLQKAGQITTLATMNDALDRLGIIANAARARISAVFGPAITRLANSLAEVIVRNIGTFEQFAERVRDAVVPVLEDLILILDGRSGEVRNTWILEWLAGIRNFGTTVAQIAASVSAALSTVVGIFDGIAAAINSTFGTEFTGVGLLVGVIVLKMVGFFALLGAAIRLAIAAGGLLVRAFLLLGRTFTVVGVLGRAALVVLGVFLGWPALLIAAFVAAGIAIGIFWEEIKAGATVAWEWVKQKALDAWTTITEIFGADNIASTWENIKAGATAAWEFVKSAAVGAWNFIVQTAQNVPSLIASALSGLVNVLTAPFRAAADVIRSIFTSLLDLIRSVVSAATQARDASISGESVGAFAGGGHVRGAGTGTSDSIWARLSNGEFVVRAAAVRHFGVNFFAALNALRVPRLNMGGMVDGIHRMMAVPHLAAGGLVGFSPPAVAVAGGGNLGTLTLKTEDGTFAVMTDEATAAGLRRYALRKQVMGAGNKPSWVTR